MVASRGSTGPSDASFITSYSYSSGSCSAGNDLVEGVGGFVDVFLEITSSSSSWLSSTSSSSGYASWTVEAFSVWCFSVLCGVAAAGSSSFSCCGVLGGVGSLYLIGIIYSGSVCVWISRPRGLAAGGIVCASACWTSAAGIASI